MSWLVFDLHRTQLHQLIICVSFKYVLSPPTEQLPLCKPKYILSPPIEALPLREPSGLSA
ncbi:hypothetical protein EPI10_024177 [Gossypium australe]|uniref:Uncharacterized protein n=1 Tax=Gossypium australe TaxID=47621 RepID=A0A5B6VX29_9ROSI|nr:hypothetical protein EPI10_024177 [Gossypium australe]